MPRSLSTLSSFGPTPAMRFRSSALPPLGASRPAGRSSSLGGWQVWRSWALPPLRGVWRKPSLALWAKRPCTLAAGFACAEGEAVNYAKCSQLLLPQRQTHQKTLAQVAAAVLTMAACPITAGPSEGPNRGSCIVDLASASSRIASMAGLAGRKTALNGHAKPSCCRLFVQNLIHASIMTHPFSLREPKLPTSLTRLSPHSAATSVSPGLAL
jgi:hypothetical protein